MYDELLMLVVPCWTISAILYWGNWQHTYFQGNKRVAAVFGLLGLIFICVFMLTTAVKQHANFPSASCDNCINKIGSDAEQFYNCYDCSLFCGQPEQHCNTTVNSTVGWSLCELAGKLKKVKPDYTNVLKDYKIICGS